MFVYFVAFVFSESGSFFFVILNKLKNFINIINITISDCFVNYV